MIYHKLCVYMLFIIVVHCKQPHIIVIVGDDMGWNDVGLHGSAQIPTPNIDALGYNGVVLNKHYTMHICTPSRSALLTGNYPIRAGMQGFPLAAGEPRALPLHMATIAEKLQGLGYQTHMIGKWHLGHQNRSVCPNGRGFKTHLGYWNGYVGYFDYKIHERSNFDGFDLHDNYHPAFLYKGKYATDVFTARAQYIIKHHHKRRPLFLLINHLAAHTGKNGSELEVPNVEAAMAKYAYIAEPQRRLYAEIVNRLDESIGEVVAALSKRGMLQDSIVVFMSDNGAQSEGFYQNWGSNWPLRGLKFTLYEGGIRNTAVVWSKALKKKQHVEETLFHISDWMPTLFAAAGGNVTTLGQIDGVNQWPLLSQGIPHNTRPDVLINIDEVANYEAILSADGRYKLTKGTFQNGIYDAYYGDTGRNQSGPDYNIESVLNSSVNQAILRLVATESLTRSIIVEMRGKLELQQSDGARGPVACREVYCLFDLVDDPTESTDVATVHPRIVQQLKTSLDLYRKDLVPQTNTFVDPLSDPAKCFNTWHPWLDPILKCIL